MYVLPHLFQRAWEKACFFAKSVLQIFFKFHIHKILYFNTQKSNMREGAEILKKKKVKTDTAKYRYEQLQKASKQILCFS